MIEQSFYLGGAAAGGRSLLQRIAVFLVMLVIVAGCTTTKALEITQPAPPWSRYSAIVVDVSTGETLYASSPNAPRFPASLTKMMTLYLLFEALDQGRVSKATMIPVSAAAARRPPTKIGFKAGQSIDVESAIHALTVKSANDVASAVGEFLGGGSEDVFAGMMTAKARQLGMSATTFKNASGLEDDGQRTTARDMAVLGMALRAKFPQYFFYFSARDFTYRGKLIRGHNDLLGRVEGVDGIKTGYIKKSGYNIVTSVRTGGRSLMIVVMGADSGRARNDHVEELIGRYLVPPSSGSKGLVGMLNGG